MQNEGAMTPGGENRSEDPPRRQEGENKINLGELFAILRPAWWKIMLFSLGTGLVALIIMFQFSNIYRATAVITPAVEERKPNPALGILATFGVELGNPSKVEDLETLFKSNDLTVRVFKKHNLWQTVLPEKFDPATGKITVCWTDRLFRGKKGPRLPDDWDAIYAAKDRLDIFVNRKAGTVAVSFACPSAEGSANIVKYYLDEGKTRLQEEALDRATRNKKFIEEQIGKTVDALTRDRLYSLYGQEVEREMMARNREQFGFRVIDSPRDPDRKAGPHRFLVALIVTFLLFPIWCGYYLVRGRRNSGP